MGGPDITAVSRVFTSGSESGTKSASAGRVSYDPSLLEVRTTAGNPSVWFFHDGSVVLPPVDREPEPEVSDRGEILFLGAKMDARDPSAAVEGDRVLLGTALFTRRWPHTPSFKLGLGLKGAFANFVSAKGEILEAEVGRVQFDEVTADPLDQDLDGLKDDWETEFFGDPGLADYDGDPDSDGFTNLEEQSLGSYPTDPASNLHLTVSSEAGAMVIRWRSLADHVYTIQASEDLKTFQTLESGVEASPPFNRQVVEPSMGSGQLGADIVGSRFFRIVVEGR